MNPWALLGAVLFGITLFAGGMKVGMDMEEAAQAREDKLVQKATEAASDAAAKAIAGITVKYTTIQQTLQKEIHEKPVYLDCRNTDVGMRSINAALEPPGLGKLPGSGTAGR